MRDHAAFEQSFGAALAGQAAVTNPMVDRALRVHRNTSAKAAMDALADNYPVVRALCGDDAFAGGAQGYVIAHPPADPRLCLYGEGFAAFVETWRPFADLPWLTDVAALERLCVEALFAADAAALDGRAIAAGLDPAAPLRLHPATRFALFASPVAAIWLAHQEGAPANALETIEWDLCGALVTRPADGLVVTELDGGGVAFLSACAAGAPLAEAAAAADTAGADVAELFSTLITAGAFA